MVWADPQGAVIEVWSLSTKPRTWCSLPVIPLGVTKMGFGSVIPQHGKCWGWTPPGRLEAAQVHGRNLIADIELRSTTHINPDAGWVGTEMQEAAALASLAGAVTSHGFVHKPIRGVLGLFAQAGATAYPQAYDDTSDPGGFLRRCVNSYRNAGFARVVPLIAINQGPDYVSAMTRECVKLGVPAAFYSLERLKENRIPCEGAGPPAPGPSPAPGPAPSRPPSPVPPSVPRPPISGFPGVGLLLAAGLVYSLLTSNDRDRGEE